MSTLYQAIKAVREDGAKFRDEHGSVEVIVASNNPLARYAVERIDGIRIDVQDGIKFVDTTGSDKPDLLLTGALIYFHTDDDPMFGSKAGAEDDWWEDDE